MTNRTYVDNAYNRKVGRVGQPFGTVLISKTSGDDDSRSSSGIHRRRGSEGSSSPTAQRYYVDNKKNRELGRVGQPYGAIKQITSTRPETPSPINTTKTYMDSPKNRRLNRVGLPYGCKASETTSELTLPISSAANVLTPSDYKCKLRSSTSRLTLMIQQHVPKNRIEGFGHSENFTPAITPPMSLYSSDAVPNRNQYPSWFDNKPPTLSYIDIVESKDEPKADKWAYCGTVNIFFLAVIGLLMLMVHLIFI